MAHTAFSTVLNGKKWTPAVQDYLENMLVAQAIADVRYASMVKQGVTQIEFPEMSEFSSQTYTAGTDMTESNLTATASLLTVDQSKAVMVRVDSKEEQQAAPEYVTNLVRHSAYLLSNDIDKHLLSTGVSGVSATVTGGALTVSTIYQALVDGHTRLFRNRAADGRLFAVMPPAQKGLLAQTFIANGYKESDSSLRNGFEGKAHMFDVYCSNNLPTSVVLTLSTNPSNGHTLVVGGVTFTFVTNGTAANAGEISIGANAAATQAIVRDAINGTGTPGASTYIELSDENRAILKNADFSCGAFSSNAATITAVGYIGGSVSAAGSNGFGTESTQILIGQYGAIALGMQRYPDLQIDSIPKQFGKYYKTLALWGSKVFSRKAQGLVKITCNA